MTTHRAGHDEVAHARWIKSSYSGTGGGNCVEFAVLDDGGYAVRDSKNRDGGVLRFTAAEWTAFTAGVKAIGFPGLPR